LIVTLLFNVVVSASPQRLAGDVGALRGVANNVSNALGAAFASVVAVGLLALLLAVPDRGGHLVAVDLPRRQVAEVCARRAVGG
jgi:hypothetical protein